MNVNCDQIEINNKLYRIEFNMDAITNFLEKENLEFDDLNQMKFKPKQLVVLCFEAIVAGARIDGKKLPFNLAAFTAAIRLPHVNDMMFIYQVQSTGNKELKKKMKKQQRKMKVSFLFKKFKKLPSGD